MSLLLLLFCYYNWSQSRMNVIYQCLFSWCIGVSFGYRVFPAQILRINYQWGLGDWEIL